MADISAIPPWIPRNKWGEPYSPELKSMPRAEKAGVERSMAAIRTTPWASRGAVPGAAPQPQKMDAVDAALAPIIQRESAGNPYVGWTGVDLSKAPLDATGFPKWPGKPGPEGNSTAAGLYQIVGSTWRPIAKQLGITDFSPESQRAVARELYRQEGLKPWAASASGGGSRMGGRFGGMGPQRPGIPEMTPDSAEERRRSGLAGAINPAPAPVELPVQPEAASAPVQAASPALSMPSATMPPLPNLHNLYRTALGRIFGRIQAG